MNSKTPLIWSVIASRYYMLVLRRFLTGSTRPIIVSNIIELGLFIKMTNSYLTEI